MISDSEEYLFFYDQRNISRHFKRFRKEPEELPQALRYFKYANLNPRIAAFLGKQDPKNLLKRPKQPGARQQDDKENTEIQRTVEGSKINDTLGLLGGFGEGLSQEARSLLPEIGPGGMSLIKMGMMDDSVGPSRLSFNETDDPQRYHFEETTFAAPNILRELSDTLARFEHAFKEYRRRSRSQDPAGSKDPSQGPKEIDFFSPGVKHVLAQEWNDMISETMYSPRQWQSQAYKSGYKYSPTLASGRPIMTASAAEEKYPGAKGDLKGMVDLLDGAPSKAAGRSATIGETPGLKRKQKLPEKNLTKTLVAFKNEADRLPRYGGNPTLSFNLSTKKAFDEGWVVSTLPDQDIEKNNILEWATSRLQMVMKQKDDDEESARKRGCDKATVIRYYGDSRRDTLMKLYKKNKESESQSKKSFTSTMPKIPQLSKVDGDRERFMVQLPDGSITLYYPGSGEVAVMASAIPNKPGQLYVHCFDNDDNRTSLATFTPYGKSCCYHKNGVPGLVLSEQGGVLKAEDGSVAKKFVWPKYGKLRENVVFHLNKEMYVRVSNSDSVTLHFSCNRESMKIQVGAVAGVETPTNMSADTLGVLQSGIRMSSKSALDYSGQIRTTAKDDKQKQLNKMRRNLFAYKKTTKKSSEIEELKKSLIPPDRFEFESQADRELLRLQHKARHLVEDWMEHYRGAVGMSSPALKKMLDKQEVRTAKRRIHSAVERKPTTLVQDAEDAAEDFMFGSTKFQSFRSPSAPPKHMVLANQMRQPFPTSSEHELKMKDADTHPAHSQSPHVRIDESQKDPGYPTAGVAPKQIFKSASGVEGASRQTHGRSSQLHLQQKARSSLLVSSTHSHSAGEEDRMTSEKVWSPAIEACPVATRMRLLKPESTKKFACKCSKHHIPLVHDIEFDCFIREMVPSKQLIVVTVVNSLHRDSNPYNNMLENLYIAKNKNRTKPCLQCRHDQFRLLRYDLARAHVGTDQVRPLLLQRHCAVPGMTLMYCSGRLLFADHIFNGYGNARKDVRKQIFKSYQDFHMGHFLPDDFRFTPSRGKPGPRAAWGGEIGGTGVECKGKPGLLPGHKSVPAKKLTVATALSYPATAVRVTKSASYTSSLTDLSDHPAHSRTKSRFDSSSDFVRFSLSTKMYVQSREKTSSKISVRASKNDLSLVQVARHVDADSTLPQMNSFLRMQTVK